MQEPKSPSARRAGKLPPEAVAALHAYGLRQLERCVALGPAYADADADLVFVTAAGRPLNPNNVLRASAALTRRADVPRVRFHDLRHTHATWLLKDGQPVKVVSERLGHAKTSITLDTYAHVLPDMQDHAVESLDAFMAVEQAS